MTASYKFGAASNFIVNITELQNTITSAGGLNPLAELSNTVAQIQQMVLFDEKRIATNVISAYNTTPIQVIDSLNLASNASLSVDGVQIAGGGATSSSTYGQLSFVGNVSSLTRYYNTLSTNDTAISFQVGAPPITPFQLTAGGQVTMTGPLVLSGAGTPGIGKYLTCMDSGGTAEWQTPAIPSDMRLKTAMEPLAEYDMILSKVRGVRFKWIDSMSNDIGLVAQDLQEVLPEAVVEGRGGLLVQYHKMIPVLVEAVKDLQKSGVTLSQSTTYQIETQQNGNISLT